MSKGNRPARVEEALRSELSVMVAEALGADPRLAKAGLATVTAVKVAGDLGVARVYVSFVGGEPAAVKRALVALERAGHTMRGEVGRTLRLRRAPELRFIDDHTAEQAEKIDRLLKEEP